ncbi:hypothetical protein EJ02DRAFT_457658 [Clathrospora elynae]|uniref:Uncharacterized protein n=1 Tax=Clathrospora elynae TaxID=706981 RepID=A0A6A5SJG8_9PLEO|nr:hypothetical protein EJ02DRAFT_457658 [Clathrospora elynae]
MVLKPGAAIGTYIIITTIAAISVPGFSLQAILTPKMLGWRNWHGLDKRCQEARRRGKRRDMRLEESRLSDEIYFGWTAAV